MGDQAIAAGGMKWEELSQKCRDVMKALGDFGPTVKPEDREVKGYTYDDEGGGKCYWTSADLREIASACEQVASWLDKRADA